MRSPISSPKRAYQSLSPGLHSLLGNSMPVEGFDEESGTKYTGTGILKRALYLFLKLYQSYICIQLYLGTGGAYAVTGQLYWYIALIVFAYTIAQAVELVFVVCAALGIQLDSSELTQICNVTNTMGNAVVNLFHSFGATGDIIDVLNFLIQIQVTLFIVECGCHLAFVPLPNWLRQFLEMIEELSRWLYSGIMIFVRMIFSFLRWTCSTIAPNITRVPDCGGVLGLCAPCMEYRKITSFRIHYHSVEETVKYIEINFDAEPFKATFGTPMPKTSHCQTGEYLLKPGELITKIWCIRDHENLKGFGFHTNMYEPNSGGKGSLTIGKTTGIFDVRHAISLSSMESSIESQNFRNSSGLSTSDPFHLIEAPRGHALINLKFQRGNLLPLNLTHVVFQKNSTGETVDSELPRVKQTIVAPPPLPKGKGCCSP